MPAAAQTLTQTKRSEMFPQATYRGKSSTQNDFGTGSTANSPGRKVQVQDVDPIFISGSNTINNSIDRPNEKHWAARVTIK